MTPTWTSDCGTVQLWCADCLDVLPTLGKVDCVVTDPPYGIGISSNPVRGKHEKMNWDDNPPESRLLELVVAAGECAVVFGGNYFALPPSQCFFVWDKVQPCDFSLAMCEFAWCNKSMPAKLHRQSVKSYAKDHPTQKPVELMAFCISNCGDARTILDPFMGSGTTGVAAVRLGRKFLGIEKEEKYFEIAKRRIQEELSRFKMFEPAEKAERQASFLEDA